MSLATEEGLAALLEFWAGCHEAPRQRRVYAARAIAVHEAASEGIVQVAERLTPAVGIDEAIELALRVKRGLTDPNSPGGLTKDRAYLAGLIAMEGLDDDYGTIRLLYATKWPIELLDVIRELVSDGKLRLPEIAPDTCLLGVATRPELRLWAT